MTKIINLSGERWHECKQLRLQALKEEPLAFSSSYEEEVSITDEEWKVRAKNALFAQSDDTIVGMVVMIRSQKSKTNHIATINGLFVKKSHRKKGVGDLLIKEAIERLRQSGIKKAILQVNAELNSACQMYKKHGFIISGKLKDELQVDSKYYDELVMELQL